MAFRERAARWGWTLVIAMPGVGLFVLASNSSGWLSTVAWVFMFAYWAMLIVAGFVYEVSSWAELEDELTSGGQEHRDAKDR